jgi:hypothetical protein
MDIVRVPVYDRDRKIVARAVVDVADEELVCWHRWHLTPQGYAACGRHMNMHRLLLQGQIGHGRVVDHINRDKLDNRRENLRVTTLARNGQNTGGRATWRGKPASSQYRGVSWRKDKKKWLAHARYFGEQHRLGLFDDEREAAVAVQRFWAERDTHIELPSKP